MKIFKFYLIRQILILTKLCSYVEYFSNLIKKFHDTKFRIFFNLNPLFIPPFIYYKIAFKETKIYRIDRRGFVKE